MTNGEEHHAQPDRDPWREVIPSCTVARAGARDQVAVHVRHGDEAVLTLTALRAPNVEAAPLKGDAGIELPQLDLWHEPRQIGDEDRKSTRLNSSHVAISYAVFCLKKK